MRAKAARLTAAVAALSDDSEAEQRLLDHLALCRAVLERLEAALTADELPADLLNNAAALMSL